ncbi:AAA family ATPase [Azospirillum formosense]|uniref:AAA family ATPase n=1 Tax=Azospirillum formosense TaxID=861533 RepID=A0ABX2KW80_9PROT|nr:AAA family ATPase [Azospirillum formosense]MBY3752749.1 AAA family ATPase [Azospirillum formosense]NUB19893.1 AAA family ATPase [Azospirillum formosense]
MPHDLHAIRNAADAAARFRPAEAPPASGNRPAPLELVNPVELDGIDIPPRRWMVRDWMPWGQTTALYGDGGLGKSLIAQMLMASAATGRQWLGLEVEMCRALAIFCEDDADELHRRQADINAAYGVGFGDLTEARWISRVGHDNLLMTFEGDRGQLTPFWDQIADAAGAFNARLVVLDTAADMFGGNENARPQVRQFVQQACTRLARTIDGAVLLCAHPSVAGMASGRGDGGNTAWNNSVRARWYLTRPEAAEGVPPNEDLRVLSRKKANYGPSGDPMTLEWREGVFRPVLPAGSDAVDRMDRSARVRRGKEAFLRALAKLAGQGRNVSHSKQAPNYAVKVMVSMPEMAGVGRGEIEAAMAELFSEGRIVANAVVGKKANRAPIFGIATVENDDDEDD